MNINLNKILENIRKLGQWARYEPRGQVFGFTLWLCVLMYIVNFVLLDPDFEIFTVPGYLIFLPWVIFVYFILDYVDSKILGGRPIFFKRTGRAIDKILDKIIRHMTKNPRYLKMWKLKTWGNSLGFWDWEERQIYGFLSPLPKVGDLVSCGMKSGKVRLFMIAEIRRPNNQDPPDMFFGSVVDIGELADRDQDPRKVPELQEIIKKTREVIQNTTSYPSKD